MLREGSKVWDESKEHSKAPSHLEKITELGGSSVYHPQYFKETGKFNLISRKNDRNRPKMFLILELDNDFPKQLSQQKIGHYKELSLQLWSIIYEIKIQLMQMPTNEPVISKTDQ